MGKELSCLIQNYLAELKDETISLRRTIHQNPEPSFREHNTADLIYSNLNEILGITVSRPTPTSVLGVLKGSFPGKTLALRSDMDALNLSEKNDISYKSKNEGIMHACGHDGHIAMMVSAAKILAQFQDIIKGEIRFVFQHAEEQHPGGARDLVKQGILEDVDLILAGHLWVALETGKFGLTSGPLMAAPDNFSISIIGKGGHAAMPQEVVDPILISAYVITSLQSVVSRNTNPLKPIVLSVTCIQGGSANNIIPERVELKGTVRTFDPEMRQLIPNMMENIIKGICIAHGANYAFDYENGYDPVINDQDIIEKLRKVLGEALGENAIERLDPVMGGEDFSEYLKIVPGALFFIGAGNKEKEITNPHHHPCFNIDETALANGTEALVLSSLGLLDSLNSLELFNKVDTSQ